MATMIKSWLITTSAPFCGTDRHYRAYAVENPYDSGKLDEWFWNIETESLFDSFGYEWDDDEFEDDDSKLQEWKEYCNMCCEECDEEDFADYVPGGRGELDIIYDERNR